MTCAFCGKELSRRRKRYCDADCKRVHHNQIEAERYEAMRSLGVPVPRAGLARKSAVAFEAACREYACV